MSYFKKRKSIKRVLVVGAGGNYITKLPTEMDAGVYIATVEHDKWCDRLHGRGPCNCNPNVTATKREDPGEPPN